MICDHELHEMETACVDGMCPLCMSARLKRTDAEIERLRAEQEQLLGGAARSIAENVTLRAVITAAMQRLNESTTGEMGLIDTIHVTHAILGAVLNIQQLPTEPSEVTVRRMRTEDWPDRQEKP
jgi:hypothetical protein